MTTFTHYDTWVSTKPRKHATTMRAWLVDTSGFITVGEHGASLRMGLIPHAVYIMGNFAVTYEHSKCAVDYMWIFAIL